MKAPDVLEDHPGLLERARRIAVQGALILGDLVDHREKFSLESYEFPSPTFGYFEFVDDGELEHFANLSRVPIHFANA